MKTTILTRCVMALMIAGAAFTACTKNNTTGSSTTDPSTTANLQTAADDQAQVSYESDAMDDDANTALNGQTVVSGNSISVEGTTTVRTTMGVNQTDSTGPRIIDNNSICDATITYADTNGARTITIVYNGTNCSGNRTRTGTISISIPDGVYWKNAGAAVTLQITNLTITRIRDGKIWIINGTRTYTNVSGGLLVNLPNLDSVVHTISGNMQVTFANGNQRTWSISKRRVFTYNDGVFLSTTGTHSDSLGNSDVAEWGTNRFGVSFESLITQPKTIAQSCEFRLTGGQNQVIRSDDWTSTITYGLDANGDPTGCPGTGTYYYKLVVSRPNGKTYTYILPY